MRKYYPPEVSELEMEFEAPILETSYEDNDEGVPSGGTEDVGFYYW